MTTNDTPQRDIPEREMGLKEWVYRLPDRHRARKEYEQLVATTNDPEARDYPTMDDPEPELSVEDQAALDALPDDLIERIISGKYKPKTAKNQPPEARGVREDAEKHCNELGIKGEFFYETCKQAFKEWMTEHSEEVLNAISSCHVFNLTGTWTAGHIPGTGDGKDCVFRSGGPGGGDGKP